MHMSKDAENKALRFIAGATIISGKLEKARQELERGQARNDLDKAIAKVASYNNVNPKEGKPDFVIEGRIYARKLMDEGNKKPYCYTQNGIAREVVKYLKAKSIKTKTNKEVTEGNFIREAFGSDGWWAENNDWKPPKN